MKGIYHFNMNQESNFKNLCNLTTSLLGLRKGSLAAKSRKQELQIARSVASVVGRMVEDIHQTVIAKEIKRDRSLIYHYEKKHESNYATFPKYRDIFNIVYNAYTKIEDAKLTFVDLFHLQDHLRRNNVRHSAKEQTFVIVKSGDVQVTIKLSYRDFYTQLELIKLAMNGYKSDITIEVK